MKYGHSTNEKNETYGNEVISYEGNSIRVLLTFP